MNKIPQQRAIVQPRQAIIKRALSYPYTRPKISYLFRNGTCQELPKVISSELHFVLAIGSNASPEQLRRKYGDNVSIPVVAVEVYGLDVVYGGILSNYGSVPATVLPSQGTVTNVHATLLTDGELRRMHQTEGGYYFCKLIHGRGVRVLWDGVAVEDVYCYVARVGALCNKQVFGVEEIEARGRTFVAKSQRDIQAVVKALMGWEEDVEEFVLNNVENKERREQVMKMMKGTETIEHCFQLVEDIGRVVTSVE